MKTTFSPYLSFKDNARQAMTFYQSVLGGELRFSTFKEYNASQDPSEDNKVMHAELNIGKDFILMAADTPNSMAFQPVVGVSLTISGEDEKELTSYFNKLSSGGKVSMPLAMAPWGEIFGSCTDSFGINWMVNITVPKK